tara:strand:- start:7770 stop:8081 length:312 start_codon:yes stop_codon:yes gene_type:complete
MSEQKNNTATLSPKIQIEIPKEYENHIDIAKFHRYCQYTLDEYKSFEAEFLQLAFTRFLSYALSSALSDAASEINNSINEENWIGIARKLSNSKLKITFHEDS